MTTGGLTACWLTHCGKLAVSIGNLPSILPLSLLPSFLFVPFFLPPLPSQQTANLPKLLGNCHRNEDHMTAAAALKQPRLSQISFPQE